MLVKVKNISNTSHLNPPAGYSSWIECWEYYKHKKAYQCSNINCDNSRDLVGAHVKDQFGNKYIVPLCQECNLGLNSWFEVEDSNLLLIK